MWTHHILGHNCTYLSSLARENNFWLLLGFQTTDHNLATLSINFLSRKDPIVTWKKKASKETRELPFLLIFLWGLETIQPFITYLMLSYLPWVLDSPHTDDFKNIKIVNLGLIMNQIRFDPHCIVTVSKNVVFLFYNKSK